MQCSQLLNDPIISHFFQSIAPENTKSTLKQLIILGIHTVSSRIHQQNGNVTGSGCCCCKGSSTLGLGTITRSGYQGAGGLTYVPYQMGNQENRGLIQEIKRIKDRVQEIAAHSNLNGQFINNHNNNINQGRAPLTQKNQSNYLNTQQNAGHTLPNITEQQANRRNKFRHHLDDSQVRQALVNPFAKNSPIKIKQKQRQRQKEVEKRRSLQKMHQFQKQKDNAQIKNKNIKQAEQHYSNKKQHQQLNTASKNKQSLHHSQSQSKTKSNNDQNSLKFKKTKQQQQRPSSKSFNQNIRYNYNDAHQTKSNNFNKSSSNNNKYSSQQSKIKSLISKDKQRSKIRAQQKRIQDNRAKYCQFQYSDQQQLQQQDLDEELQEQSGQQHQHNNADNDDDNIQCPVHPQASTAKKRSNVYSSYKKSQKMKDEEVFGQIYKSNRKKIKQSIKKQQYGNDHDQEVERNQVSQQNQQEDEDDNAEQNQNQQGHDEVSENSSFSKFSMNSNSRRESGKISGLKGRK